MHSKYYIAACILLLVGCQIQPASESSIAYTIDTQQVVGENTKFWQALGHDFLFQLVPNPVGKNLLDRMQRTKSCTYFRTHYTFSNETGRDELAGGSICGNVLTYDEQG